MAQLNLNSIFLSASIPYQERDKKFYDTSDIIAIRDAVRALATVVIPKANLIWGGHPSITPLIRFVIDRLKVSLKEHVTLYQSNYFRDKFPEDNFVFEKIELVPENTNLETSLSDMRNAMINNNDFKVGIFIGGMEGVIEEYSLFSKAHPNALILPIASTGAAAKIIYDEMESKPNKRITNDYAYMALFRDLLAEYI